MDEFTVETRAGRFRFCGRRGDDPARPALLAVTGAFPKADTFQDLVARHPGADVLVAYLPGMAAGLPWSAAGMDDLTLGLEQAALDLLGARPLVVFGASAGALPALGFRGLKVVRKVLVEPFLTTRDLWPFIAHARTLLARHPGHPGLTTYLWSVFGVSPDALENRDYAPLLARNMTVADVIVAQVPLLPERPLTGWPSFTSADDRAALAANPLIRLHEAAPRTGHALYDHALGGPAVQALINAAMDEAAAARRP